MDVRPDPREAQMGITFADPREAQMRMRMTFAILSKAHMDVRPDTGRSPCAHGADPGRSPYALWEDPAIRQHASPRDPREAQMRMTFADPSEERPLIFQFQSE
jgi:hypothetical protein